MARTRDHKLLLDRKESRTLASGAIIRAGRIPLVGKRLLKAGPAGAVIAFVTGGLAGSLLRRCVRKKGHADELALFLVDQFRFRAVELQHGASHERPTPPPSLH